MSDYRQTFSIARLWTILIIGLVISFSILLYFGREIYQVAPPIPEQVVSSNGTVIFEKTDIEHGQNIWQSMGGMQQGSIWGHGSYVAPDWSADWLHREGVALLEIITKQNKLRSLSDEAAHAAHLALLQKDMRTNSYNPQSGTIIVSENRRTAIEKTAAYYKRIFTAEDEEALAIRRDYALPLHANLTNSEADALNAFFFWTSWAAITNRPHKDYSYTSNWPYDPMLGNVAHPSLVLWSVLSVILLLAGIGAIVWYYAKQYNIWHKSMKPEAGFATSDIMDKVTITPSMRATAKYFWLVTALFAVQIVLGIITAHYAVEGQGLYGLPLADYFPYAVTRTWHTQLAVYWIATAWLAAGLYIAPLLTKKDPPFQRAGVNFLFGSLLVIVVGSFIGEWSAVHRFISNMTVNFWFGHQGYEYVDLGRFWQIYLAIGLLLWVFLVLRGVVPLLREKLSSDDARSALVQYKTPLLLVGLATVSIGVLYLVGLLWGQNTHLAVVNYWRWWVVHLWVEGMFEVFATAIVSVLFVYMGLLRVQTASVMVLIATIIFLAGGVLGTFHHLYFSGTPIAIMAIGASFSALEVVPLTVIGFEAYHRSSLEHSQKWEENYRWCFNFFAAVLFWNLVGAGIFGFLINPPISLYYVQGLNLTANHGHAALFGVYGMLGLGLMLYCMRGLTKHKNWDNNLLSKSFWSLNIGLAMMTFLSLLPQGIVQSYASITKGYHVARSSEIIHSPLMESLVWLRVPGDLIFAFGVACFALFTLKAFLPQKK